MPTVKVGDINMYYEVHGDGEPLFLITGRALDLTNWMFQIPEFSKKYQVVAFDNRGAGRTDAPDAPYSIKMMADDTVGLMNALGINRAHILGLSMGGYIAQKLAIECPGRAKSLILAATWGGERSTYPVSTHVANAWLAARTEGISPKTLARIQLPYLVTDQFFEKPEIVKMWVDAMAANPYQQPAYACGRQLAACAEHHTRGQLKQITAPTLVLVGKEDMLLPVKLSVDLAESIPKAKLVVLEGGGHLFNIEIRDKFNQAVLDFLAQIA